MPVSGSTLVAAQRTMRLTILSRALADRDLAARAGRTRARPASLRHRDCRESAADRPARRPRLDRRDRGEIDDRDHLGGDVGEAVAAARAAPSAARAARRRRSRRRTARSRRGPPACAGRRAPPRGRRASMVSVWLASSKRRAQRGQPLVAHQHQEAGLGQIAGRRGIEAGRPVLDGIEPVGRQGLRRPRARRAPAARATAPSPDSGRWRGFSRVIRRPFGAC